MKYNNYYKEKFAFIPGGSEGIGLAVASELVKSGADVVIASRSSEKLTSAISTLEDNRLSRKQVIDSVSLDVTDYKATEQKTEELVKQYRVPNFLINCAGFARPGYMDDLNVEAFRQMMELNYFGILHTVKAILPHFMSEKKGTIVNTSSMAGFLGLFGYTGYCASKYAAIGFSDALRHELMPFGIKVSVLCPPNTRTPGLDRENQFKPKEVLKVEEKAKVVNPDEVAASLLKALPSGKFMIIPTFDGKLAYSLSRYSPWLIDQFIKRPTLS